jgi:hypothetical protein
MLLLLLLLLLLLKTTIAAAALPCSTPPNKAPGVSWDCTTAVAIASGDYFVGSCLQAVGAQLAKCNNGSYTFAGSCTPNSELTYGRPLQSYPAVSSMLQCLQLAM